MAIPSLAESVWISIAIRFEARITQHERVAELRAAGDVGGEVARVDVGDAGDERGAEERQDPELPARALQRPLSGADRTGGDRSLTVSPSQSQCSEKFRRA